MRVRRGVDEPARKRRRRYTKEEAELVQVVYKRIAEEKEAGKRVSVRNVKKRVSHLTSVSERSVARMYKDPDSFAPAGEAEIRDREYKLTIDMFEAVHKAVIACKTGGCTPSVRRVHALLQEVVDEEGTLVYPYCRDSLWRHMKEMGYSYERSKTYGEYVQEMESVKEQRVAYLRKIREYREEGREIFYQDESWVNANIRSPKEWKHDDMPNTDKVRGGLGKRTILCGIGSARTGWLNGRDSFLMFHGKLKVGSDYHEEMSSTVFLDWMKNKVLPFVPDRSVVVIDRATYHLTRTAETRPPNGETKAQLLQWLRARPTEERVRIRDSSGKDWTRKSDDEILLRAPVGLSLAELKVIVKKFSPEPEYEAKALIDKQERDLKLLLLPTHHPELNPIELQWGRLKAYAMRHNTSFNLPDVEKLVWDEYDRVTVEHWAGCERRAIKTENEYWKGDDFDGTEE